MLKLGTMGFKPDDIKKIKSSGIESDQIIELAKNGYTAKDVDELIALTKEDADTTAGEHNHESTKPDDDSKGDGDKDKLDYKSELDKRDKTIEEMKTQISNLQDKLASKDLGGAKVTSARDQVKEAFRNLY